MRKLVVGFLGLALSLGMVGVGFRRSSEMPTAAAPSRSPMQSTCSPPQTGVVGSADGVLYSSTGDGFLVA